MGGYGRNISPTCSAAPLVVNATLVNGPDNTPAAQVEVQYTDHSDDADSGRYGGFFRRG